MATPAFGAVLEAALKLDVQGGRLAANLAEVVDPKFFCCVSGTSVGVAKDPVALMAVSATRLCTGDAITVTYSGSWSPSSTIAGWEVNWGDGNTSSGAFPGAGSVAHPLGGYTFPGTYTITLTVTDLLGYTGTQSVTVEVLDCDAIEIDLFAGCGSSGVWRTTTAGNSWSEAGGGTIDGVQIHDLKPNLFTLGLEVVELWAATENGLYKGTHNSTAGTTAWERIIITPEPDAYVGLPFTMQTLALTPSKYDPDEFFLLGYDDIGGTEFVWLLRTVDGGDTWTNVRIGGCDSTMAGTSYTESIIYGGNTSGEQPRVTEYGGYVYELDTDNLLAATRIAVRSDVFETWSALGGMVAMSQAAILAGDGSPYRLWVSGFQAALATGVTLQAWDGIGWTSIDTPFVGMTSMVRDADSGYIYVATRGNIIAPFNASVRIYDGAGNLVTDYETPGAHAGDAIDGIALHNGELFIYCDNSTGVPTDGIFRHVAGDTWAQEHSTTTNVTRLIEHDGTLYGQQRGTNWPLLIRDDAAQTWSSDIYTLPTGEAQQSAVIYDGNLYIGTDEGKIFRRDEREGYMFVASVSCDETVNVLCSIEGLNNHDDDWLAACHYDPGGLNESRIFRLPGPNSDGVHVPTLGRTHIMDMSADGMYVFIGLLDGDNFPFIVKVLYDLSEQAVVYDPGTGTWPGVACDPWYGSLVWIYGDFGNGNKVRLSDDWGENFGNETDGAWGAGELVRPLLISDWDERDVIAVLNTALEIWRTYDLAATWANVGTPAFAAQSGTRDPYEPENVWIGRAAAGANHLQRSPNGGVDWQEASSGITANAPITGLVVTD